MSNDLIWDDFGAFGWTISPRNGVNEAFIWADLCRAHNSKLATMGRTPRNWGDGMNSFYSHPAVKGRPVITDVRNVGESVAQEDFFILLFLLYLDTFNAARATVTIAGKQYAWIDPETAQDPVMSRLVVPQSYTAILPEGGLLAVLGYFTRRTSYLWIVNEIKDLLESMQVLGAVSPTVEAVSTTTTGRVAKAAGSTSLFRNYYIGQATDGAWRSTLLALYPPAQHWWYESLDSILHYVYIISRATWQRVFAQSFWKMSGVTDAQFINGFESDMALEIGEAEIPVNPMANNPFETRTAYQDGAWQYLGKHVVADGRPIMAFHNGVFLSGDMSPNSYYTHDPAFEIQESNESWTYGQEVGYVEGPGLQMRRNTASGNVWRSLSGVGGAAFGENYCIAKTAHTTQYLVTSGISNATVRMKFEFAHKAVRSPRRLLTFSATITYPGGSDTFNLSGTVSRTITFTLSGTTGTVTVAMSMALPDGNLLPLEFAESAFTKTGMSYMELGGDTLFKVKIGEWWGADGDPSIIGLVGNSGRLLSCQLGQKIAITSTELPASPVFQKVPDLPGAYTERSYSVRLVSTEIV